MSRSTVIGSVLYATLIAFMPNVPHMGHPDAAAQVATSSTETVPFYTLFTERGLDRFHAMYVGEGKGNGALHCIANAEGVMFDLDTSVESLNRTWHYNVWSLDRCVSRYYGQPLRTWKQFLTTRPMARYAND